MNMYEFKATKGKILVLKKRGNRAMISCIVLRFETVRGGFCYIKNRATMNPHRATILKMRQIEYEFNAKSCYDFLYHSMIFA